MTLTALTPYGPRVPSTRVRVRHWIERTGITADIIDYAGLANHSARTMATHLPEIGRAEWRQRRLRHRTFDRLLIHKEVTPFSSGALAEHLLAQSALGVYDFDDAVMWTDKLSGNSRWSPAGMARTVWDKAEACRRTVQHADRVIAGNEVLADWAASHNADVRLIPSCVEPADYTVKTEYDTAGVPRVVWLGSPATEPQLQLIADAMVRLNAYTGARMTVISAGTSTLGVLDAVSDRVEWYPGVERTLAQYDLAFAPLFDEPYERGKSAYKIVQYGASALPTIGSPVAANATVLRDLGQVAVANDAWVDAAMDMLRASTTERARVGEAALSGVMSGYSFAVWQNAWLAAVGESPPSGGH